MLYLTIYAEKKSYDANCVLHTLNSKVNEHLKQGWELQGGVSISKTPSKVDAHGYPMEWHYTASQALIKND